MEPEWKTFWDKATFNYTSFSFGSKTKIQYITASCRTKEHLNQILFPLQIFGPSTAHAYSCNLWTRSGETLFMWFRKITSPLSPSFSFTRILRNGQPSAAVFFQSSHYKTHVFTSHLCYVPGHKVNAVIIFTI